MNCTEFQQCLNTLLDGQAVERTAFDQHAAACPQCREWQAAAERFQVGLRLLPPIASPIGLSQRIVGQVLRDRRQRSLRRENLAWAGALAASLFLAIGGYVRLQNSREAEIASPSSFSVPEVEQPETLIAAPSLRDSVAEAGNAVVSLTRRTADDTVEQTRFLLTAPIPPMDDATALQETLDTPTRSLREAGQGVSAGLEPITNSARRAFDLFLREVPRN